MKEAEKTSKQKRKDKQAERPRKQNDTQERNETMNPEEERIIGTSWKMQKHDALKTKIGYDLAENEPQDEGEQRTKEGGTQLNFNSLTAALPLDDIGIFWITSAVNLVSVHVRWTSC